MTNYKHPLQGCEFDDMPLGGCYVPLKLSRNMKSRLIPYGIDGEKADELWTQLIQARPVAYQEVKTNRDFNDMPTDADKKAALDALNRIYMHLDAVDAMCPGVDKDMKILRDAVKTPRVKVIPGLTDALIEYDVIGEGIDPSMKTIIAMAANEYLKLMKGE